MKLADLIDLEWLLREGAELRTDTIDAARPAVRRACIAREIDPATARGKLDVDRSLRVDLALAFLSAARERSEGLPGHRSVVAIRLIGSVLVLIGLALGFGTARVVLAYDGTTPINVLHVAFVFFAVQLVLLGLMLWFLLRSRRPSNHDGPPLMHRPVAWLVDRALGAKGRAAAEALRALRTRASLYAAVERWTLFALAQRLGVAFNVAALATTLALVVGTDLVFSWSTTLVDVSGDHAHRVAKAIALPWSWLWPEAVPSLDIVQQSRWVRMPGAFAGNATLVEAQQFAAQWWHFLIAGLVTYGLVPRLLALAIGTVARTRALAATGLDHAGCHALFDALLPSTSGWSGPDPDSVRGEAPSGSATAASARAMPPSPGSTLCLVCWGSLASSAPAVAAALERRFGVTVASVLSAGGAALDDDVRALDAIAVSKAHRLTLAFAAGRQPTSDVLQFVRRAREKLGAQRPIVAVLLESRPDGSLRPAEAEEVAIWRRAFGALGDSHLWVDREVEA